MSDQELPLKYLEKAKALGIDVNSDAVMSILSRSLRLAQAELDIDRPRSGHAVTILSERLGIPEEEVRYIRQRGYMDVARQLVMDTVLEDLVTKDVKSRLMEVFSTNYLPWLENMSRIALGRPDGSGKRPTPGDQIKAFESLQGTKINQAFLGMVFLGRESKDDSPEQLYVKQQAQLSSGSGAVIDLDQVTISSNAENS